MSGHKYAIGVDYGTESGRAVLVDVTDGQEVRKRSLKAAGGIQLTGYSQYFFRLIR